MLWLFGNNNMRNFAFLIAVYAKGMSTERCIKKIWVIWHFYRILPFWLVYNQWQKQQGVIRIYQNWYLHSRLLHFFFFLILIGQWLELRTRNLDISLKGNSAINRCPCYNRDAQKYMFTDFFYSLLFTT